MSNPFTNYYSHLALCYHAPMFGENDNNLINFIATTVGALRARVDTISDQMATKVDVANLKDQMATVENQMATKEDLVALRAEMATKEDLLHVESRLDTMGEQMATKDGLGRLDNYARGI